MSDLDAKLTEVAARYDAVQAELGRPEVLEDPSEIRRLGQELSQLEPVVEAFRRLEATRAELAGAREMRDTAEGDEELKAMAREEIDSLEADETRLIEELKVLLLPRDPNDEPRRHPRDPGRRRRRRGRPVRRRAVPDVRALLAAPSLHARAAVA